jgi:RNA polymerase sigma factor (sigma-70 family)
MKSKTDATELFEHNMGLARFMASKWIRRNLASRKEEIHQVALIGLWEAALAYDPARGVKFSTFAGVCIYSDILNFFRNERRHRVPTVSLDEPLAMGRRETSVTLLDTLAALDSTREVEDRELEQWTRENAPLVAEWALDGRMQKEIGRSIGRSQPHTSRLIAAQVARLREEFGILVARSARAQPEQ